MTDPEIQNYVQQQIAAAQKTALYSTKNAASHTHNGVDSPKIANQSLVSGVSSIIAGTNVTISPSGGTGDVTVNSTASGAVSSVTASGSGISASPTTGAVVVQNTGVTSILAGSNISVSGATGAVTVSATGSASLSAKCGVSSRLYNTASGAQTIAHGLGKTPAFLDIVAGTATNTPNVQQSIGTYDGTNNNCAFLDMVVGAGAFYATQSFVIYFLDLSGSNYQRATALVDATNIYLNWTKGGLGSASDINFMWKVAG